MSSLLGTNYRQMYEDYYDTEVTEKRRIAACDIFDHIRGLVGTSRFTKVIDVGAGEGSLLELLDKSDLAESLYAVEISSTGLQAIRDRGLSRLLECQSFDGYHIPYPDKFFDLVVSTHVLEHVEHERLLLGEIRRIGKRFVLEVPLENGIGVQRSIAQSGPYGHINFYCPATFLNLLTTCGFRVIKSQVLTSSLRYEQYCAGRVKGLLKHLVRRGLLGLFPHTAPWVLTYVLAVYCEAD